MPAESSIKDFGFNPPLNKMAFPEKLMQNELAFKAIRYWTFKRKRFGVFSFNEKKKNIQGRKKKIFSPGLGSF